jgi:hypothetical protein
MCQRFSTDRSFRLQWRDYIYCTGVGKAREIARIDQFGPCK